ncbi:hypothetical protein OIDMADRAFT_120351 [Oidiodendron maius Zn]|uniref:Invertebrate defensins family profile domain-containing protein n=1 Tax=Oidiodendron maius (strain Zn) TaxID=913774 RepID=A0A0C3DMQ6_OIDMZ|nr:hypothetical protein OIDMADRAFT_120351 [Oidiodendron maius Zn]
MRFTTSLLWLLAIGAATACLPSLSCTLGGFACNNLCVREVGRGGHCEPNDQCPGNQICVCDPATKRSEQRQEKINGEAGFIAAFEKLIDTPDVERREATDKAIEARSICCSFPNPIGGLCCDDHCSKIGKPGGQCTTNDGSTVCVCN